MKELVNYKACYEVLKETLGKETADSGIIGILANKVIDGEMTYDESKRIFENLVK